LKTFPKGGVGGRGAKKVTVLLDKKQNIFNIANTKESQQSGKEQEE
jgi:hypothetical protein